MNDASSGQPHGDEYGYELGESNGARCLQNVQVLEDVGHRHQSQGSQEPQSDPRPVQVNRHEGRWYRKVVHERVHLQHEPQLVTGGDKLTIPRQPTNPLLTFTLTFIPFLNQLQKLSF